MKSFYFLDLDCSKSYETFCDLVRYSHANNIPWYQESGFSHFLNIRQLIYSCSKEEKASFEFMLQKYNVNFTRIDFLEDSYSYYIQTINGLTKVEEGMEIPIENQVILFEEEFPSIIEGANGSIISRTKNFLWFN